MAVEGALKDMSLVSLVQTICMEQRRAVLVLKRRTLEEGVIFFEAGKVVHATAGALQGVEAVYHLLGWTNGTFRLSDNVTIPQRTIDVPWNHILLEGMKRIDHQETRDTALPPIERALSPAERQQDSMLENDLILLLSQLEHALSQLASRKNRNRPTIALQILAEMVNDAAAFSEEHASGGANTDSLARTLALTGDTYPAMRILQPQNNRLSAQTMSKMYSSWASDSTGRRQMFQQIGQSILDVLERYFALFTSFFRSPSLTHEWQEMCRVFLRDLTPIVAKIRF
jgi:hypothetical protein